MGDIQKVLIANRGEIACRIIRTCKEMGIRSVAVYGADDSQSKFVRLADEAVRLEGSRLDETYLNSEKIIAAAHQTGADAVHPGYGFLSENEHFASKVKEAGLVFIGPRPDTISLMGDKIRARAAAVQAQVPVVPGGLDPISDLEEALKITHRIGYPVLLKARAGGGGKGMRIVHDPSQFKECFESASREALSSFGNGEVFVEKYVLGPHHIEVQILGDTHGHIMALGERECSIQRRHQKIIEESPSPFISNITRKKILDAAIKLAAHVGYVSAGTVEFIVDQDQNFYFLEMNTRLQVEHPVTEMVFGVDLVREMILIAEGKPLEIKAMPKGHAIEVRLYAENPSANFLPMSGWIEDLDEKTENHMQRIDSGLEAGDMVGINYDPLLAKLIAWGSTRQEAISHIYDLLASYTLKGPLTNQAFLMDILKQPTFYEGAPSTHFIQTVYPEGFHPAFENLADKQSYLELLLAFHLKQEIQKGMNPALLKGSWVLKVDDVPYHLDAGLTDKVQNLKIHLNKVSGLVDDTPLFFLWSPTESAIYVHHVPYSVLIRPLNVQKLFKTPLVDGAQTSRLVLKSPMPGLMTQVRVAVGDQVEKGQTLLVLEAMKMENSIKSPISGKISIIHAEPNASVTMGQPLITLN